MKKPYIVLNVILILLSITTQLVADIFFNNALTVSISYMVGAFIIFLTIFFSTQVESRFSNWIISKLESIEVVSPKVLIDIFGIGIVFIICAVYMFSLKSLILLTLGHILFLVGGSMIFGAIALGCTYTKDKLP